ncbi:hypothetical protein [Streptomyces boninensis]|uniref:hypothetical protein n=1 Tax=Streptomyces boninensis TaxID=2039455 RepID=UPI003B2167E4
MTRADQSEAQVRRLLQDPYAPIPLYLAERAITRGRRVLRRRRVARLVVWVLAAAVLITFAVWVQVADPFAEPPSTTTPDFDSW